MVKVGHTLSRKLHVLRLVFSYRHMRRTVHQHIGSLQDGIGEKSMLEHRVPLRDRPTLDGSITVLVQVNFALLKHV